jgi:Tfp pilus assembly protein PilN
MNTKQAATDGPKLGAVPRAHLLPPEVTKGQKARSVRRVLFTGLVGAVVLVLAGVGAAIFGVLGADTALQQEQSNTPGIEAQLSQYGKVTSVQSRVTDIESAQNLGTTGEIEWMPYISSLQATLPAGTTITSFTTELESTLTQTVEIPLQGEHVATLKIVADSPRASISDWLDNLASLKGFVSATPGSVALLPETGHYTVTVEVLIDKRALENRFAEGSGK